MLVRAYIDDSGNSEPPAFVLGSLVSTPERWEAFCDEWRQILNLPPAIQYFKTTQAYHLRGQFHRWSEADRDARVVMLAKAIVKHATCALVAFIHFEESDGLILPNRKGKRNLDYMRFLSLSAMLNMFTYEDLHAAQSGTQVELVLDHGIFKGYAHANLQPKDVLPLLKRANDKKPFVNQLLWPPVEGSDLDILPLQAADLLASTFRWSLVQDAANEPLTPIAGAVFDVISALKPYLFQTTRAHMTNLPYMIKSGDIVT